MFPRVLALALLPLAALALAEPTPAQCLQPDNLDGGPCCAQTNAFLPSLSGFKQDAQNICWRDCNVDQVQVVRAKWVGKLNSAGTVAPCGEELLRLDILTPSGVLLWRGNMTLTYSRTFLVVDTNGLVSQVWRYLVNGDLRNYPAAGTPPCPVPPCASSFGGARFTGYLDAMQDCSPLGGYQFAWMLTHACDALDHHVGFPRAGIFHPDRSYSFVGPALGFVPGPIQPVEGTSGSTFEALRVRVNTPAPTTVVCAFEEPAFHTLTPQGQFCFCGAPGTNQFLFGDIQVVGSCGTAVRNPPGAPLLPGFVSMGLGSWTNPNAYPGVQALRWNIGAYDWQDACNGSVQLEVFYGVTTLGGYQAYEMTSAGAGNPLPPIFIDQGNSVNGNGATVMNRPFRSFHILNLNH